MGTFICEVEKCEGCPQIPENSDNLKLIFIDADFRKGIRNSNCKSFQIIVGTPLLEKIVKAKASNRQIAHGKRNGKSLKVIKHGTLCHQYNEIWCFLMREQYIKIKVANVIIRNE